MPKMTKAQLVEENIALRHNLSLLEAKLAELTTQRVAADPCVICDEVVVATYTKRDGTHWNKVRTSWNTYAHRQVA